MPLKEPLEGHAGAEVVIGARLTRGLEASGIAKSGKAIGRLQRSLAQAGAPAADRGPSAVPSEASPYHDLWSTDRAASTTASTWISFRQRWCSRGQFRRKQGEHQRSS
jgi:hypothetical protein